MVPIIWLRVVTTNKRETLTRQRDGEWKTLHRILCAFIPVSVPVLSTEDCFVMTLCFCSMERFNNGSGNVIVFNFSILIVLGT